MDFEDLFEMINFELVLEGIGMIFGFYLLWKVFFHSEAFKLLLSSFITSVC